MLLAFGYAPVVANVSNTVGLVPGSASGAVGYRRELRGQRQRAIPLAAASVIGGVSGAVLLLVLPASAFKAIVPVFIAIAVVLIIAQPRLTRAIEARRPRASSRAGPAATVAVVGSGVYGGYFGAAQGILLLAILGLAVDDDLQRVNALKVVLAGLVNLLAALVFILFAHVAWGAAALIAGGSARGGWGAAPVAGRATSRDRGRGDPGDRQAAGVNKARRRRSSGEAQEVGWSLGRGWCGRAQDEPMSDHSIELVGPGDVPDILPLMRAYCDFYEVSPSEEDLVAMARALIDDPERQGVQLIARDGDGRAVGFATVFWSWSTSDAARLGVMNDLFVTELARGHGLAERLIEACRAEAARRGARRLTWQTAPDNARAQAVYDRIGATRERWIDYWLPC